MRDYIQYLKAAKNILITTGRMNEQEFQLFALSDVIDESQINSQALVHHIMCMYESVVGRQVDKVDEELSLSEI